MDGSVAIEENREALKRIVATLVDMAGLGGPSSRGARRRRAAKDPPPPSLARHSGPAAPGRIRRAAADHRRLARSRRAAAAPAQAEAQNDGTAAAPFRHRRVARLSARRSPSGQGGWSGRRRTPRIPTSRSSIRRAACIDMASRRQTVPLTPPRAFWYPASPSPPVSRRRHRPTISSMRRVPVASRPFRRPRRSAGTGQALRPLEGFSRFGK
jgi:hypothetical protein